MSQPPISIPGHLEIDPNEGVAQFRSADGPVILRVTHLKPPVPPSVIIDISAVRALTSYTLLEDTPIGQTPS